MQQIMMLVTLRVVQGFLLSISHQLAQIMMATADADLSSHIPYVILFNFPRIQCVYSTNIIN